MANTKFTPGPWANDGIASKAHQAPLIKTSDNKLVAMVWSGNKSDGDLIAAAPEMFQMLTELYQALGEVGLLKDSGRVGTLLAKINS